MIVSKRFLFSMLTLCTLGNSFAYAKSAQQTPIWVPYGNPNIVQYGLVPTLLFNAKNQPFLGDSSANEPEDVQQGNALTLISGTWVPVGEADFFTHIKVYSVAENTESQTLNPYVVYRSKTSSLHVVHLKNNHWVSLPDAGGNDETTGPFNLHPLAVDTNNVPYIFGIKFSPDQPVQLFVKEYINHTWKKLGNICDPKICTLSGMTFPTSILVDKNHIPYVLIGYRDSPNNSPVIYYVKKYVKGQWEDVGNGMPITGGDMQGGFYATFTLSDDGTPYIAYNYADLKTPWWVARVTYLNHQNQWASLPDIRFDGKESAYSALGCATPPAIMVNHGIVTIAHWVDHDTISDTPLNGIKVWSYLNGAWTEVVTELPVNTRNDFEQFLTLTSTADGFPILAKGGVEVDAYRLSIDAKDNV